MNAKAGRDTDEKILFEFVCVRSFDYNQHTSPNHWHLEACWFNFNINNMCAKWLAHCVSTGAIPMFLFEFRTCNPIQWPSGSHPRDPHPPSPNLLKFSNLAPHFTCSCTFPSRSGSQG